MKTHSALMKKTSHMFTKIVSRGSIEISSKMTIAYSSMFCEPVRKENIT